MIRSLLLRSSRAAAGARGLASQLCSDYSKVTVTPPGAMGRALLVSESAPAGACVLSFVSPVSKVVNMHSLQVGQDVHANAADERAHWIFMNHSCTPSCRLELLTLDESGPSPSAYIAAIANVDMRKGDPVTFDYNTTEWSMASGFTCGCETTNAPCVVGGASRLSAKQRSKWQMGPHAWQHIKELLAERGEP
jgi:hypothetical protein